MHNKTITHLHPRFAHFIFPEEAQIRSWLLSKTTPHLYFRFTKISFTKILLPRFTKFISLKKHRCAVGCITKQLHIYIFDFPILFSLPKYRSAVGCITKQPHIYIFDLSNLYFLKEIQMCGWLYNKTTTHLNFFFTSFISLEDTLTCSWMQDKIFLIKTPIYGNAAGCITKQPHVQTLVYKTRACAEAIGTSASFAISEYFVPSS